MNGDGSKKGNEVLTGYRSFARSGKEEEEEDEEDEDEDEATVSVIRTTPDEYEKY